MMKPLWKFVDSADLADDARADFKLLLRKAALSSMPLPTKLQTELHSKIEDNSQVVIGIPANHNIHTFREGSELLRNAFPGVTPHNHEILTPLWCIRSDLSEIFHFFGQAPWKTRVGPDSIRFGSCDDDGKTRHANLDQRVRCEELIISGIAIGYLKGLKKPYQFAWKTEENI